MGPSSIIHRKSSSYSFREGQAHRDRDKAESRFPSLIFVQRYQNSREDPFWEGYHSLLPLTTEQDIYGKKEHQ